MVLLWLVWTLGLFLGLDCDFFWWDALHVTPDNADNTHI